MLPPLLQIEDIILSTDILTEYFACDYDACHGLCCIDGESGAPLNVLQGCSSAGTLCGKDEAACLREDYPSYMHLMSEPGRKSVAQNGFSVLDRDGDQVTPLVGSAECAYCHISPDKGCLCAIEMASKTKPVSCSLYPIRTRRLGSGALALNLHRWSICRCGFEKGRREGIHVYEFLRAPLVRAFGEEFYRALEYFSKEYCNPDSSSE